MSGTPAHQLLVRNLDRLLRSILVKVKDLIIVLLGCGYRHECKGMCSEITMSIVRGHSKREYKDRQPDSPRVGYMVSGLINNEAPESEAN